jgi:hypothetical protein
MLISTCYVTLLYGLSGRVTLSEKNMLICSVILYNFLVPKKNFQNILHRVEAIFVVALEISWLFISVEQFCTKQFSVQMGTSFQVFL